MKFSLIYILVLLCSSAAIHGDVFDSRMFLPFHSGDKIQYSGKTYIDGPLVDLEVNTYGTFETTLYNGSDSILQWTGNVWSDNFTFLFSTTSLDLDFSYIWGPSDTQINWYASMVNLRVANLVDGFTNAYDIPIKMLPRLIKIGETYNYSGTANGRTFNIAGSFEVLELATYNFSWGSIEGLWIRQSSPYDDITVDFFLARDFGVAGLVIYGSNSGYDLRTVLSATSLNRPYSPKQPRNIWDLEGRVGTSNDVLDSWFGWLDDSKYPWTYSYKHGWIWADTANWENFWFYSTKFGWCYTSLYWIPWVYSSLDDSWFVW